MVDYGDDIEVQLRGAPYALLRSIVDYQGPERNREVIICGAGGTGKSRGTLQVIAWLCEQYPGLRVLLSRSTRESMTSSTLVEWEECFPAGHPALEGPQREGRSIYHFPNGSEVAVIGLDKPGKLFSTKWDIVYVEELTGSGSEIGVELDTWELFQRGLRGNEGVNGQRLLIGSCNPSYPTHWVKQRIEDGACEYFPSFHRDNPAFHDGCDWTPRGKAYLQGLSHMTGHRKRRLLLGEWCAAEGQVWDEWDSERHITGADLIARSDRVIVTPDWSPIPIEMEWTFASFDWGYSDPGAMGVWGVDSQRRMWLLAQIYRTRQLLDWWSDRVAEFHNEFGISAVVVDPSRNDAIADFNRRIAVERGHAVPGFAIGADNRRDGDFGGMEAVRTALSMRSDGYPGVQVLKNSLRYGEDPECKRLGHPTRLELEVPQYVFKVERDGKPNRDRTDPRCKDHACDMMRYACTYAFRRDMRRSPKRPRYAPGTYGATFRYQGEEIPYPDWSGVVNAN